MADWSFPSLPPPYSIASLALAFLLLVPVNMPEGLIHYQHLAAACLIHATLLIIITHIFLY
ncbi:MAG: hypothetical protein JOS17DRAFT_763899 [Linnemannia elongata]|nr:MAG: hypothetical protein JOS17DRAFT_763899 [Linnemannia elongata]